MRGQVAGGASVGDGALLRSAVWMAWADGSTPAIGGPPASRLAMGQSSL
jgi:hypothetical protein